MLQGVWAAAKRGNASPRTMICRTIPPMQRPAPLSVLPCSAVPSLFPSPIPSMRIRRNEFSTTRPCMAFLWMAPLSFTRTPWRQIPGFRTFTLPRTPQIFLIPLLFAAKCFVASIASWLYTQTEDVLFVHQYIDSVCEERDFYIRQTTRYPSDGEITLEFHVPQKTVALRIPGWASSFSLDCPYHLKNGYAYIPIVPGQTVHLSLAMKPVFVFAHPSVRSCSGKTAIMRGPVVYCAEGIDNGEDLFQLCLDPDSQLREEWNTEYGLPSLIAAGGTAAGRRCRQALFRLPAKT